MERTFVMLKPDALQRRLAGHIIARLEQKGLRLCALKLIRMTSEQARGLYEIHHGKPFYEGLVRFVTSGPVLVSVWEGHSAVSVVRKLLGATFGYEAEPGTIRGDFGSSKGFNLVHGSDSPESVVRELPIFFREEELVPWNPADLSWVLEEPECS